MAQHKSAEKRHRQSLKRKARNHSIKARMRKAIREARAAVEANAEDKAARVLKAVAEVNRAASKRVLKSETASRYMSRLMKAGNR